MMRCSEKIRWVFFPILIFVITISYKEVFAIENYQLKLLFEMKLESEPYKLYFAGQPWRPQDGGKPIILAGGPKIKIDNSGNFYLLNFMENIVKLNSKGGVIKEIKGPGKFTKPDHMALDRWDNLYVVFRNDTNIVDDFKYMVVKFDSSGNILNLIGNQGGQEPFKGVFLHLNINGTLFLNAAKEHGRGLQRFDKDSRFTGFVDLPMEAIEGIDGDIYVVDKTVKKFTNYDGSLKKIRDIKPVTEKDISSKIKGGFLGFDVNNNLCFRMIGTEKPVELPNYRVLVANPSGRMEYYIYNFATDKIDTLRREGDFKKEGNYGTWYTLRNYNNDIYEIHIYFNDPPNVTPQDHVKFFKWEKMK